MKIQSAHSLNTIEATELKSLLNSGFMDKTVDSYTLLVRNGIHHAEIFFSNDALPENVATLRAVIQEKTYLLTI